MRLLIFLVLFLSMDLYSQDIFPAKNIVQLKRTKDESTYNGYIIYLNKQILMRSRGYGDEFWQNTLIVNNHKYQYRAYVYFSVLTFKITPAISIRRKI